MKKTALALAFLLSAASLLAGEGHGCDMHAKNAAKTVEMTGKIFCKAGSGESCERMFQAATKDAQAVAICHGSKADLAKLGDNVNVKVKAKMVKCEDDGKDVLFIEEASKI